MSTPLHQINSRRIYKSAKVIANQSCMIRWLSAKLLSELKHQGLTAEKSSAQKLNQGGRANVLNIVRS
jgi:hypothetical protein